MTDHQPPTCKPNPEGERIIRGRHLDNCDGAPCTGCQPCYEAHCDGLGYCHRHIDPSVRVCPRCVGKMRERIMVIAAHEPLTLAAAVESGRVDSPAAMLAGPAAEPMENEEIREALYLRDGVWEHPGLHPFTVLGALDGAVREARGEQVEAAGSVRAFADYLLTRLDWLATTEALDFGQEYARLRQCQDYLQGVLALLDRPRVSQVLCIRDSCDKPKRLEQRYGTTPEEDRWVCPGCFGTYTMREYTLALAEMLRKDEGEKWVRATDAREHIGRPERTFSRWLADGDVATKRDHLALMVWWPDVRRMDDATETRKRGA